MEERENEEAQRELSWSGILKGQILNGVCTAVYKENDVNLRYCYKVISLSFSLLVLYSQFFYALICIF